MIPVRLSWGSVHRRLGAGVIPCLAFLQTLPLPLRDVLAPDADTMLASAPFGFDWLGRRSCWRTHLFELLVHEGHRIGSTNYSAREWRAVCIAKRLPLVG